MWTQPMAVARQRFSNVDTRWHVPAATYDHAGGITACGLTLCVPSQGDHAVYIPAAILAVGEHLCSQKPCFGAAQA